MPSVMITIASKIRHHEFTFVPTDLEKAALKWAHGVAMKAGQASPCSFWWFHKKNNVWLCFHRKATGIVVDFHPVKNEVMPKDRELELEEVPA